MAVTAMGRGDPVVVAEVLADARRDRLLAGIAVDRPPDLVLAEQRRRALLEAADLAHDLVQVERGLLVHHFSCGHSITRIAPSRRSMNVAHASANRVSGNWCVVRERTSIVPSARSASARPETRFGFATEPRTSRCPRTIVERSRPESS